MARSMRTKLLVWLLVMPCSFQAGAKAYSAGDGTAVSPYVLSCKDDIMELASRPEDFDKSFILATDIDMGGEVFDHSIVSPDIVFVPSFSVYRGFFTGRFNGNGHVISNFSIRGNGCHGFFGGIGWDGEVIHLGLEDAFVDAQDTGSVGMLAGVSMGFIVGCYSQGHVAGYGSVGGLVGYQYDGRIVDCFSQGHVEAAAEGVGGLVGVLWEGEIQSCYVASTVAGATPSGWGGLIGRSTSGIRGTPVRIVSNSFWDVEVSGVSASAGGLGLTTEVMYDLSTYLNATWDFTEEQNNGINDVWMHPAEGGYPVLSAFSGMTPVALGGDGSIDHPYMVSTARELAAMVYYTSGRYWGFSFFAIEADIDMSTSQLSAPVLPAFYGHLDGRGHSIRGLRQEGSCGLFGVIEAGATVTKVRLEEAEVRATEGNVGCVAAENHGSITQCSVSGIVTGGDVTGGLVGRNEGIMWNCSFSGAIAGGGKAGGILGDNAGGVVNSWSRGVVAGEDKVGGLAADNVGSMRSCYSTAAVTGYSNLGGLVGANAGGVTDCYARGDVAGAYFIGGLIGQNSHSVSRCYSTGSVIGLSDLGGLIGCAQAPQASALNSFWDIESSGIQLSAGGTAAIRTQLQDISTFLNAGWDLVGETVNGTQDLWVVADGDYPELTLSLQNTRTPARR